MRRNSKIILLTGAHLFYTLDNKSERSIYGMELFRFFVLIFGLSETLAVSASLFIKSADSSWFEMESVSLSRDVSKGSANVSAAAANAVPPNNNIGTMGLISNNIVEM